LPFPYTFPIIFGYLPALTINIDGVIPEIKKGSTSVDLRIEERSKASFIVVDREETKSYQQGQPITIYDATDTRIFGGVIQNPIKTYAISPAGGRYHHLTCSDWHYLADKRLVAESYLATAAGTIVTNIITNYLADEGVTVGNIEAGPDIVEAVFNYVRASDAFDALAEKAGKIWFIDENKALYFQDRDITAAPWDADSATNINDCRLVGGNPKYRNRQYIRGGRDTTLEQTEEFVADGKQNAFTLSFSLAKVPTSIKEDGGAAKTLGIKGLDAPGDFEYYWNKGDPTIYATIDPGAGVVVEVKYYGFFDILVLTEDPAEIAAQQTIEGAGTGYVEDISDEPKLTDKDASIDSGQAKLARLGVSGRRFKYQTVETGLKPGQLQTINYPTLGVNSESMLIESVAIGGLGSLVTYDIVAITGPETGSWESYFKALASMKQEVIDRLNIGTEQILIILVGEDENWGWTETIVETPATCSFPSLTTYPSLTIYPC